MRSPKAVQSDAGGVILVYSSEMAPITVPTRRSMFLVFRPKIAFSWMDALKVGSNLAYSDRKCPLLAVFGLAGMFNSRAHPTEQWLAESWI